MFLKRRNIIAAVLLILASVCWTLGQRQLQQAAPGTTSPHASTAANPSVAPTLPSQIPGDVSTAPPTSRPIPPSVPTTGPGSVAEPDNRGKAWGIALGFAAVLFAAAGILGIRQKSALLGPDGAVLLLAFVGLVKRDLLAGDFAVDLWFYGLFTFCVLLAVQELWGWLLSRLSLSWCAGKRLALRVGRPQIALLLFAAWIAAAAVGLCGLWTHLQLKSYLLTCGCILVYGLLGCACLWQYGADLHHFRKQLENFHQGLPIQVKEGTFAEDEKQLLTVQKQHEEAVRTAITSERFRVDLIANVSHDLRTPLTSILGYGELLQKQTLSPEGETQLARLNQKAGYMRELVESLFELTKVSSGAVEARRESIDLIRLLEQTVGLMDDQLAAAGLTVKRHYAGESMPVVTDGARMHQVFANLLGNAIKYALAGTRVHLHVREEAETVTVRMVNTAAYEMDFSPEEILQRFARGDKARSTKGSGLGLAIAQTYTESVGGSFRVAIDGDQFSATVALPKTERNL